MSFEQLPWTGIELGGFPRGALKGWRPQTSLNIGMAGSCRITPLILTCRISTARTPVRGIPRNSFWGPDLPGFRGNPFSGEDQRFCQSWYALRQDSEIHKVIRVGLRILLRLSSSLVCPWAIHQWQNPEFRHKLTLDQFWSQIFENLVQVR